MNKQIQEYPKIQPGKRCLVVGRTGSGKTVWGRWMLNRSPGKWIILDMKHDEGFQGKGRIITDLPDVNMLLKLWKKDRWIIIRPKTLDPDLIDQWIEYVHESVENVGLFVDELYYIHTHGQAGRGLIGWLTRGRSRKQSFLGGTQRPAWISKFLFSESDRFSIFSLNLLEDRKRVYEFVGDKIVLQNPPEFCWRWYDISKNKLLTFGKVPA